MPAAAAVAVVAAIAVAAVGRADAARPLLEQALATTGLLPEERARAGQALGAGPPAAESTSRGDPETPR